MQTNRNCACSILFTMMILLCTATGCKSANTPSQPENAAAAAQCDGAYFHQTCLHIGDVINFGNYPQSSDAPAPISWKVLDIDKEKRSILLLSAYILDAKPYHSKRMGITWENSEIRAWLNGDFVNAAFDEREKAEILTSHLTNEDNNEAHGGNETDDKVFLLTLSDAYGQTYSSFHAENEMAVVTEYAIKQGATSWNFSDDSTWNGAIWDYQLGDASYPPCKREATDQCTARWWLRTPGYIDDMRVVREAEDSEDEEIDDGFDSSVAVLVGIVAENLDGCIHEYGFDVSDAKVGVRPALRVKY
ncbi:MAG: hypothetical protein J6A01_09660 [Proteobacteria bacterium]|nr:hypothetical protein [Pseudomonadota bacterium]